MAADGTDNQDKFTVPSDAPRGDVTLSANAGAFGPWCAHQAVDVMAKKIADQVKQKITLPEDRILVVSDPAVLGDAWTAQWVTKSLDRLEARISVLAADLTAGQETLERGIGDYQRAEQQTAPGDSGRRSGESGTPAAGSMPLSTLSTAVSLLGLVRTDYTLTPTAVAPSPATLAMLTAVHLAAAAVPVAADAVTLSIDSRSLARLTRALSKRDELVAAVRVLQQKLAPAEQELAALGARADAAEKAWSTAVSANANDNQAGEELPAAVLRRATDTAAAMAIAREQIVGPAQVLNEYAKVVLGELDADFAGLTGCPDGALAPIHAAARWERLRDDAGHSAPATHVLYVALDGISADIQTRRTLLGASGLLRVIAAGNASWALHSVAAGAVVAGGHVRQAEVMSYSLGSGAARRTEIAAPLPAGTLLKDPARVAEYAAKALVIILAVVLAAVGVASFLAVIRVAFP